MVAQTYSSADTSLNQVAAVFKKFSWSGINLDLGGGKYDKAQEWMVGQGFDCLNLVYDPFNRSEQHNLEVLSAVTAHGGADTCTISNVLNVIAEEEIQLLIIRQAYENLKVGGEVRVTVYEGDRSGMGRPSSKGYQRNEKLALYLPLVQRVFPLARIKNNVIIGVK